MAKTKKNDARVRVARWCNGSTEELRAKTKMSPVDSHAKPPKWLKEKIVSAAKTLLPDVDHRAHLPADYLLQKLLSMLAAIEEALAAKNGRDVQCAHDDLYDHSGCTVIDREECYVLEPYPSCDKEEYETALNVATRDLSLVLGCHVSWQADSWYYPGFAYRILFQETL
jgi:hypothetical protein